RINKLCEETGLTIPDEDMDTNDPTTVAGRGFGISKWYELFTPRQLLALLTFTKWVKELGREVRKENCEEDLVKIISTYLSLSIDRMGEYLNTGSKWDIGQERNCSVFIRQAIPMVWDYSELNPFEVTVGSFPSMVRLILKDIKNLSEILNSSYVTRTSATELPYSDNFFDAIITDPPYYNN
ncbi:MAG: DUF1156 domain-containing protein, partial [Candidatus Hydrothermales bacterium]